MTDKAEGTGQIMTKQQARLIVEAHEVEQIFNDEEELKLLDRNNPELLGAYKALLIFSEFGEKALSNWTVDKQSLGVTVVTHHIGNISHTVTILDR